MSHKLLLADDSITIQKVVELILSEEDFTIVTAGDGEEAYVQVKETRPDIVLADVDMPKINGYDLCKKIKAGSETSHIPVILLIGAFEPVNEQKAREVGADDVLIKPFESQEFLSKLHSLLDSSSGEEMFSPDGSMDAHNRHSEEPMELSDSSVMNEGDLQALLDETMVEETAAFEEDTSPPDSDDDQSFVDSDLTTKELKDVLETLGESEEEMDLSQSIGFNKPADHEEEPEELSEPGFINQSDIDALLGDTMLEDTPIDKPQVRGKPPKERNEVDIDNVMDTDKLKELMEGVAAGQGEDDTMEDIGSTDNHDLSETSLMENIDEKMTERRKPILESSIFEDEDKLMDMFESVKSEKPDKQRPDLFEGTGKRETDYEPKKPPMGDRAVPRYAEQEPLEQPAFRFAGKGDVLLTTGDINEILKKSLDVRVSNLMEEDKIHNLFEEAISAYVSDNFKDIRISVNDLFTNAVNQRISEVVSQINLEIIVNQVISSTIKGILANLAGEVFKMTREVTEKIIKGVLDESIPLLKSDVEKVIYETVPTIAGRLIKDEIEKIKSEFM
ncbi:MAG: response regulator [Nitrospirae bacterium]|nr:response regulator [Nitrospirota bacterium]